MPEIQLTSVDRVNDLTKEQFQRDYLKQGKPVIFRSLMSEWAAKDKWHWDYLKQGCGDVTVPLFDRDFASNGMDYMQSNITMSFAEYLDLIANEPTKLRMFLFNVFKYMPQLLNDFNYPDFGVHWITKHPFFFCGGQGSVVDVHYDLDLSHVFLSQFEGKKRVLLFSPRYSNHLYQHPLTVSSNVDLANPNFERYPKLKDLRGVEANLEYGDTLFIPSRWWHYIEYTTGGYSMSLRAVSRGLFQMALGVVNIAKLKILDANMSRLLGSDKWYNIKESIAQRRASRL